MTKLHSVKKTAEQLDVAPVTVIRLVDQGLLSAVIIAQRKRKRLLRFRPEAIERFIANRERRTK